MEDKTSKTVRFIAILSLFIGFAVLITMSIIFLKSGYTIGSPSDPNTTASIATSISGIVGTIWVLGSYLLFYLSVHIQNRESQVQRISIIKQNFETTFFNLNQNHLNIRERMYSLNEYGGNIFNYISNDLKVLYKIVRTHSSSPEETAIAQKYGLLVENLIFLEKNTRNDNKDEATEITRNIYSAVYKKHHKHLGQYFRLLYHIFKYIDTSLPDFILNNESNLSKDFYFDILQAEMSTDELYLTFMNGIIFPKMHKYLNDYNVLSNLYKDEIEEERFCSLYPDIQFKER